MRLWCSATAFCVLALPGCLLDDPYYVGPQQPAVSGSQSPPPAAVSTDDEDSTDDVRPGLSDDDSLISAPALLDSGVEEGPRPLPMDPVLEPVVTPALPERADAGTPVDAVPPPSKDASVVDVMLDAGNPDAAAPGPAPATAICGNGVRDPGESCDGESGVYPCALINDAGYVSGTLVCSSSCEFDTSQCELGAGCGNGVVEPGEECDGDGALTESCDSLDFSGGRLRCTPECNFDTNDCSYGPACDESIDDNLGMVFGDDTGYAANNASAYTCSNGGDGGDFSLSWTAPATGCYVASISSNQDLDTIAAVFEDCRLRTELACDDNSGADQFSRLEFTAVLNTTYAIVLDSYYSSDEGNVDLRITPCPPPDWTCPVDAFGSGDGCDCGCGAVDFDCNGDEQVSACDFCNAPGSCAENDSCDSVSPEDNASCQ